jgi:peptidoglycan hydrolase-like protein with peptidoglycan-binding domain
MLVTLALMLGVGVAQAQTILPAPQPTQICYIFSQNLHIGSRGESVRQLQVLLNQSSDTQVTISGAGSPGNESLYFGPATMRAVIKFQEKHSFEVLAPAGLVRGTGFVGRLTLAKLNTLCNQFDPMAPVIQSVTGPKTLKVGETGTWKIQAYDPAGGNQLNYNILWGDEVKAPLYASGAVATPAFPIHDPTTSHSYSRPGIFIIAISATNLSGKTGTYKTIVQVTGTATGVPVVTSLDPVSGPIGTIVKIYGTNIAPATAIEFGSGFVQGTLIRAGTGYLEFTVPSYIGACPSTSQICAQIARQVTPGTYGVAITNANGTSNRIDFTVTGQSDSNITVVAPNGGETWVRNTQQTIKWNTPNVTYIQAPRFDISLVPEEPACRMSTPPCMIASIRPYTVATNVIGSGGLSTYNWTVGATSETDRSIPDGRYKMQVCTQGGGSCDTSDGLFTISSQTAGIPVITSITPSSGSVGTQVTIKGNNFSTANDSSIFFNNANNSGTSRLYVSSIDGTTLKFIVPNNLISTTGCPSCGATYLPVTAGVYTISVLSADLPSNAVQFTVTQ